MVVDAVLPPEKVDAFNHVELLKDPSHARALTLAEFMSMATEVGLKEVQTDFFKVEMDLEAQLRASFPNAGDDDKIRQIYRDDLGRDSLGVGAHLLGDQIHFAYPVLILVGKKALAEESDCHG